eukprot:14756662-Alexandrium_andersonii.AAC.1
MSASLVGSEMCIRDRVWVLCGRGHWCGRSGIVPPAPASRLSRSLGGTFCLLYTSDAADDM